MSLVLPAFNETGNISVIVDKINRVFEGLAYKHEIIIVDDGSSDDTLKAIKIQSEVFSHVYFLEFSRNFGHQLAVKAGMDYARGNCIISMDCDLQHPPELIPELLKKWEEGYDVVYTIRAECKTLSKQKRKSSRLFYRTLNWLSGIGLEPGTADFRLMDRQVVDVFKRFSESEPFLRGLIKWVGFKQYGLNYDPAQRFSGDSKYTVKKMMRLALQGVTSFSIKPLYTAVYLGFCFSILSILYIPYVLYAVYFGREVSGWASIIMTIVFFGGLQLIILGIIGIYIGKMFLQNKNRPNYIVRTTNLNPSRIDTVEF